MAKNRKDADIKLPPSVSLRITEDDEDDFAELFRRMNAAGFKKPSTYIKHLLRGVLHPDTTGEMAVRKLLRDLSEATSTVQDRVEKLDSRTKKLRETIAYSVVTVLVQAAHWPQERAEKWVQENLLS